MTDSLRVYVNGSPVDVAAGATALDCIRAWNAREGEAVAGGTRVITDSRGLPTEYAGAAFAGAIYRTVSQRSTAGHD